MRTLIASLILLMPLAAAGQTLDAPRPASLPANTDLSLPAAPYATPMSLSADQGSTDGGSLLFPLWRDADGRMLALVGSTSPARSSGTDGMLDFRVVDVSQAYGYGLRYDFGPHVTAYAKLIDRNWLAPAASTACKPTSDIACADASTLQAARLLSGEVGASYSGSGYRFDLLFDSSRARAPGSPLLPRVLPQSPNEPWSLFPLDTSTNLSARGRLALGSQTGIDLGASMGRIRLLPGNLLGVDRMDQQSLSLGVDSGSLSGRITGRMLQPTMGAGNTTLMGANRRWTTIDLGVTWRLPWQGELRFGAHNLWSSGQAPMPAEGPEPDQSRIPYVQYHQDL